MTTRNPIVLVNGEYQELPSGDVLGGAAQGPVGMTFQNTWSSVTSYNQNDVVFYNGSSYIALQANTNQTPPAPGAGATAYWNYIAWQGATGPTGATGATGATGTNGTNGAAGGMSLFQQIITAGSQTTIDFTSIPTGSSTIKIHSQLRSNASGTGNTTTFLRFNNDSTSANYTTAIRAGTQNSTLFSGNVAASGGMYVGSIANDGNTAGLFSEAEITILNYASTNIIKRLRSFTAHEDATNGPAVQIMTNRWNSVAAINRVTIAISSSSFKDGGIASLYLIT